MNATEETEVPVNKSFGDTELGQMLGCGFIILCCAAGVVVVSWFCTR